MLAFLTRIAAISVLVSGVFYTSSVAYYGGYLQVFSLDTYILHRNVDQVLYHGFIFLYPQMMKVALTLFVISCIVMFLLVAGTHYKYRKLNRVNPRILKLALYDFRYIRCYMSSWLFIPLVLTMSLLLYIGMLADFERQGIKAGNDVKTAIEEGNVFNQQCIQGLNSGGFVKNKLVINLFCGANTCVGTPLNSKSYIYYETKNIVISSFDENSKCGYRGK
ncbi:hypothetical protein WKN16_004589 [Vibrio parahaemolyticus]